MGRRRRKGRLYRKGGRWYADLRDFWDVLGPGEPAQAALVAPGERYATTDPDIAQLLLAERLRELEGRRRGRVMFGVDREVTLGHFAEHHLVEKARAGRVTRRWLAEAERRLGRALEFFGAGRPLVSIRVPDVQKFAAWLAARSGGRNGNPTLSPGTVRHHLNDLSNLFGRAQAEGLVPPGWNPVAAMLEKPVPRRAEARWLEVHEAALLLEAARLYKPEREDMEIPLYAIVATFLLTGGRESEVLGLEVDDISFDRRTVTFRPNAWRRLKTSTSHRAVPLWPQLEEILRAHLYGGDTPHVSGLLFRSPHRRVRSEEQPIRDLRRSLDVIAVRAGWQPGEIRTKVFRHTYCAARLQTLDRGAPVSPWTVAREMGHGGRSLVDRVYGHLGEIRHRSEVVEYRVEDFARIPNIRIREQFGERLRALRALSGA